MPALDAVTQTFIADTTPYVAALDRAWTRDAQAKGSAAAFARWAAPDVRFYRDLVVPVQGVATFSNLKLTKAGTYTLRATCSTLTPATSGSIIIAASVG